MLPHRELLRTQQIDDAKFVTRKLRFRLQALCSVRSDANCLVDWLIYKTRIAVEEEEVHVLDAVPV